MKAVISLCFCYLEYLLSLLLSVLLQSSIRPVREVQRAVAPAAAFRSIKAALDILEWS